jgi:hypothetical protein
VGKGTIDEWMSMEGKGPYSLFVCLRYWGLNSASCLLGRRSPMRAVFALVILEIGSHFLVKLAWTTILLLILYFLSLLEQQVCATMPTFSLLRWGLANFFVQVDLEPQSQLPK